MANAGYVAANNSLIQMNVSDEVRGRVMSLYSTTVGLQPLGLIPAAAAAEAWGAPLIVMVSGVLLAACMLSVFVCLPGVRRLE